MRQKRLSGVISDFSGMRQAIVAVALLQSACTTPPLSQPRLSIGVKTALPLFMAEDATPEAILNGGDQRAAVIKALAGAHQVKPLDQLTSEKLRSLDELILAQPRALPPEELVAVDQWVRDGGRALVFADPALAWPSDLPLGDHRRAPAMTMLDPLLTHWGLQLALPENGGAITSATLEGLPVKMVAAGRWIVVDPKLGCVADPEKLVATCAIGKGNAVLVADADMLDQRLWDETGVDGSPVILALVARLAQK